jgi:hypothetical protein
MTKKKEEKKVRRVSDIVPPSPERNFTNVAKILDYDVEILDFEIRQGQFGEYAIIDVNIDGEETSVICGGREVLRKLREIRPHLPLTGRFVKRGRMYDLI